ncbi:MAG: hypothetical protein P4L84_26170 [Isosphaeraceae bacterium]|nr:hypothetical protein [Isosphaeraceae bacterium]
MNAQEMLDYAFRQTDDITREQIQRAIADDPILALRLDRLEHAIERLVDDGEVIEPPRGLAERSILFVAERRRSRRTILEFVPVKVPFRWADIAVAAGILLAGLVTLLPAVHRSRQRMDQAGCGFNLQQLGLGLAQYVDVHHYYPYATADSPASHAGTFPAMLKDAGLLSDVATLDCPCNGKCAAKEPLPSHPELAMLRLKDPERYRNLLCWDYAYNVGYRHASGRPGPVTAVHSSSVPMLADQPPHDDGTAVLEGNSPNHGGRGQNVLFADMHVRWHNTRRASPLDSDMFLNDAHRPAPGLGPNDAVLLPGQFPFEGH